MPNPALSKTFETEALPHAARLLHMARWLERDRRDAEDLVQETLLRAWQSFHRYTPGTNCRAWLTTVLHRAGANRRRSRARHPIALPLEEYAASAIPFVPPVPESLTDEDLLAALASIPSHYREAILLRDIQDMTHKEIADALAVPVGTVMSRLHRGRQRMRTALAARGIRSAEGVARTSRPDAWS